MITKKVNKNKGLHIPLDNSKDKLYYIGMLIINYEVENES